MNKLIKISLIGSNYSGKTNIINKYINNSYKIFQPTVGVDFLKKIEKINNEDIKIFLWDTCGDFKLYDIIKLYIKNINIILYVFDLNNIESFNNCIKWINIIKINNSSNANNIQNYLIGAKSDLEHKVDSIQINEICKKYNLKYYSCSSKENNNILEMFKEIIIKQMENNNYIDQLSLNKKNTIRCYSCF